MEAIRQAALWLTGGFLGAMAVAVAFGMLTGRIHASGLLTVRGPNGRRQVSAQRVQLLVATLAGAGQYLLAVLTHPGPGLPEVPQQILALMGLSHISYLGGKGYSFFKKD